MQDTLAPMTKPEPIEFPLTPEHLARKVSHDRYTWLLSDDTPPGGRPSGVYALHLENPGLQALYTCRADTTEDRVIVVLVELRDGDAPYQSGIQYGHTYPQGTYSAAIKADSLCEYMQQFHPERRVLACWVMGRYEKVGILYRKEVSVDPDSLAYGFMPKPYLDIVAADGSIMSL
jgi:hypothetical protein